LIVGIADVFREPLLADKAVPNRDRLDAAAKKSALIGLDHERYNK